MMGQGHGNGKPQPHYTLYVRLRDGIMRMVTAVGAMVPVAHWHLVHYSVGSGVRVTPVCAIGVTIFEDEFVYVEEFPLVRNVEDVGGKTAEVVASEKEPSLVV